MRFLMRFGLVPGLLLFLAGASARAAEGPAGNPLFALDFSAGLPDKWDKGVLAREGLPAGSKGAVASRAGQAIQCFPQWADGHFTIEDGLYFNYRATFTRPQWYQVFLFGKTRGAAAEGMSLYEAKPPVDGGASKEWRVVSIPFSEFKGTMGPGQGKAPLAGSVCWTFFWSFQDRDLGMVVDRVWVSRGKPDALPGGGSLAAVPSAWQGLNTGPVNAWPEAGTWAFEPPRDEFRPEALLDLRSLNEKSAGESGFVRLSADGSDFVLGDGKPARFWAVNTGAYNKHPRFPAPDLARHARFLAKRGVNMVRFHGNITPAAGALTDIDGEEREKLWRLVAAMRKEGIYTTFSPYWAVSSRVKPALGVLDAGKGANFGLLFFDPKLQAAYKAWMRQVLSQPNPYTGIPLAQDPALAIIQLQNEDSLLFWTSQNIQGEAAGELRRQFAAFAARKYGSLEKAREAWAGASIEGDDFANGQAGLHIVWELTQDRGGAGQKQRCADQMQFFTETMFRFHRDMAGFLRGELGCKQLVNAGNWRTADNVKMLDAERYAYSANEVIAVNRYYTGVHEGPNAGWAIIGGDRFTDPSVLLRPREFPLTLKQVAGHPMIIPESTWVPPISYQSEAPFLVAAYQSLTGIDAYYWFATGEEAWRQPGAANGYRPSEGKWVCATPMLMGQWPAAALLYRMGYVKQAPPAVVENRALTDLWQRRMPIIAEDPGYDPNGDAARIAPSSAIKTGVNPLAYLAGPVVAAYDADPAGSRVADLSRQIDDAKQVVTSLTGDLRWDYGKGVCTLNAPCAQGAAGFLKAAGPLRVGALEIRCANEYATVLAVSLDGRPLPESRRVLVQVGTAERPTGWKTRAVEIKAGSGVVRGEEVVDFGRKPWRIQDADITLAIANPGLSKVRVLDTNGMPVSEAPLQAAAGGKETKLPANALYVVLE